MNNTWSCWSDYQWRVEYSVCALLYDVEVEHIPSRLKNDRKKKLPFFSDTLSRQVYKILKLGQRAVQPQNTDQDFNVGYTDTTWGCLVGFLFLWSMCLDVKSEFNLVCSIYHYLVDIVSVETGGKLKFLFSSDPDSSNCSRIICVCVWGGGS